MGRRSKPAGSTPDPQASAKWLDRSFETSKKKAESRGSGPVADANRPEAVGDQPRSGEGTAKRRWL